MHSPVWGPRCRPSPAESTNPSRRRDAPGASSTAARPTCVEFAPAAVAVPGGWRVRYSSQSNCNVTPGRRNSRWIPVQSGSSLSRAPGLEPPTGANSSASSPWSVSDDGNGHVKPAAATRSRQSRTVLRAVSTATAIARDEAPHSYFSRLFRVASHRHSFGRHRSPSAPDEKADRSPAQRSGNANPLRGWPTSDWNRWPTSRRKSPADITSECLADLPRNTQIRASRMSRPDTPMMLVSTEASLMLASSSVFCRRWTWLAASRTNCLRYAAMPDLLGRRIGTKLARINPCASRSASQSASATSVLRPGTFLTCAALARIRLKSPSDRIAKQDASRPRSLPSRHGCSHVPIVRTWRCSAGQRSCSFVSSSV